MKKIFTKDTNITLEQQKSLLLLLATFKSFTEQLYNLKGVHARILKKRFNMLQYAANNYEREIDQNWLKENKEVIEELTDSLTDLIYMLRNGTE